MKISKVVVIGSGTMGSGIAAQVANAGLRGGCRVWKFFGASRQGRNDIGSLCEPPRTTDSTFWR